MDADHVHIACPTGNLCFNCRCQLTSIVNYEGTKPEVIELDRLGLGTPHACGLGHSRGFTMFGDNGEAGLVSFIEALTYLFELDQCGIDQLNLVGVNDMALCECCYQLLSSAYNFRRQFQHLTATSSCIFNILKKSSDSSAPQKRRKLASATSHEMHGVILPTSDYHTQTYLRNQLQAPAIPAISHALAHRLQTQDVHATTTLQKRQQERRSVINCSSLAETDQAGGGLSEAPGYPQPETDPLAFNVGTDDSDHRIADFADHLEFSYKGELPDVPPIPIATTKEASQDNERRKGKLKGKRRKRIFKKQPRKQGTCSECGKTFFTVVNVRQAVQRHVNLVHRKQTSFICDICGRPTTSDFALKKHRKTHLNAEEKLAFGPQERFLCSECGLPFKSIDILKCHIARIHEKTFRKEVHTCSKCDYSTPSKRTLNTHMRAHEIEERGEFFYSCKKCPMKFKFLSERKLHPPSCPGEIAQRPHLCMEHGCERRFKFKQALELHLNEFHKFGPVKAREMVYPGLPPKKILPAKVPIPRKKKRKSKP